MSNDLVNKLIERVGTSDYIQKMREENEEKAEKKRLELAGAITRLIINDTLREVRQRQQIVADTKGENQA